MLGMALWLVKHNIPVFPLHTPVGLNGCSCGVPTCGKNAGKHPRIDGGHTKATTDKEQVNRWWGAWPDANIGVPTGAVSGVVVFDADPRHGGPSDRFEFQERYGEIPDNAAEAKTGGGGLHIYFKYDPKQLGGKKLPGKLDTGVEIKTDGGYVVVAPSLHFTGNRYLWDGMLGEEQLLDLPGIPQQIIERAALFAKKSLVAVTGEQIWKESERNKQLTSFAGTLRRKGMSREAIEAALIGANANHCEPPLDKKEVQGIAASIVRYAPEQIASEHDILQEPASRNGASRHDQPPSPANGAYVATPRVPETASAAELFPGHFPPPTPIIDKLVYRGLTLVQSPPKLGKSYFAVQAALSLIDGSDFMGFFRCPKKLRVLNCDLEGTKERAHNRLNQLGEVGENSENLKFLFRPIAPFPDNLQQIGEKIAEWKIDFVIIDTLLALLKGPSKKGGNLVRDDYDIIDRIRQMCAATNTDAMIISHSKKHTEGMSATDSGIHSTGTTASVDSILTFRRLLSGSTMLEALPRDGESCEYEIELDPIKHQGWRILAMGAEAGQSKERNAICAVLKRSPVPLSPKEVADSLGKNHSTTKNLILKLAYDGVLELAQSGKYRLRPPQ